MPLVSVTRLSLRAGRYLPIFHRYSYAIAKGATRSPGFQGGALLVETLLTYWTRTLWRDESSMRTFFALPLHLEAIAKYQEWTDEAVFTHWMQEDLRQPSWQECYKKIQAQPHFVKLAHPSANHKAQRIPALRSSFITNPLRPR